MNFRIATIVGARPQFVKAAAISRAIRARPNITEELIHTGQHFDDNMSDVFFRELDIPKPKHNLGVNGGPHGQMTGRMMEAIENIVLADRPDLILIYGDTNSTLAAALVGAKLHIPVAHVEAGLRSYNRRMPEEVNRVLADHVSSLLLCPTQAAIENLKSEGIAQGVVHSGDVMYDATLFAREAAMQKSSILETLDLAPQQYAVCTIHRSENTDSEQRLRSVVEYVEQLADNSRVIFPIHPRTRQAFERYGITPVNMTLIDPLGYLDLNRLLASANLVATDSGGLQKEAYFHHIPCVTLRDETEWVETLDAGWNRLWTSPDFKSPRVEISDYGNGDAAVQIVTTIEQFLNSPLA